MQELAGKHIVLGLTGGIACYKSAELCRLLVKQGASVQVVMTEAAERFITPVTMQALSLRPVYGSQWDAREPNNMPHINLSRQADAVVIAPCSADFMASWSKVQASSSSGLSRRMISGSCPATTKGNLPSFISTAASVSSNDAFTRSMRRPVARRPCLRATTTIIVDMCAR